MTTLSDKQFKKPGDHKLVISGPITGVPDYRARFDSVAKSMRTLHGPGVTVFSPSELPDGHTERWYMARCAEQLETATHVYFMSGWEYSAGCRAEWAHAVKLGLVLSYQD